ncbi:glycoside hydrolase family 113 [Paenibacillus sp. N3.4]|uniref:glycoside hydrolase family 113 n=1 Tax=Paenibacillus sp. N3.4 TaxID=2603222 RepID=UPI0011C82880|nr:hydrolase [Paenibacillus sp. N3.4]TXK72362.1 hydrolase [Paenibacillus sp. N3.4]
MFSHHKPRFLSLAVVIIVTAVVVFTWMHGKVMPSSDLLSMKLKSGNLSVDYTWSQALLDVDRLSLNTVNVPVKVSIDNVHASKMSLDILSVQKAKELIKELKKRNITVILEPYPWISSGEQYETDWQPDNIPDFFDNWQNVVLNPLIQQIAIPERVDALCMASNLRYLEPYVEKWSSAADKIREQYKGLLTYKSNWWYTAAWDEPSKQAFEEKLNNAIFSKVDFISIGAYFELSDRSVNTVDQLKADLLASSIYHRQQPIIDEIERLHIKWNKPIFLGELGFPKRDYAAMHPWNPSPSDVYNGEEQARGFEAYRQAFTQDWFLGFSVFAIGKDGEDKHYYPSEESAAVIRKWFEE